MPGPIAPVVRSDVQVLERPLQGFYGKRVFDGRIPILGHVSVSDEALLAAREKLHRMLALAPKIRANLEGAGHELHVVALRQFTSDLPEHRAQRGTRIDTGELFDHHMIGGHITGRLSSCTEATLLPIVGHNLFGGDPCVHELAHAVEALALGNQVRGQIVNAYRRSMQSGRWRQEYASKNEGEWFAEMTRYYFRPDDDSLSFYDPALARGRAWLKATDPDAWQFVDDLYSGRIDPGTCRVVRLALGPPGDEATLRSRESLIPAGLLVRNRTSQRIHMVWLDFDGHRDPRRPFDKLPAAAPGGTITGRSWASHPFVITDDQQRGLCTFVMGEDNAEVEITGPCR